MKREDMKKWLIENSSRFVRKRMAEKEFRKFRIMLVEEFYLKKIDAQKLKEALGEKEFENVRGIMKAEPSQSIRTSRTSYDTVFDLSSDSSEVISCESSLVSEPESRSGKSESELFNRQRSDPKLLFKPPAISIENLFLEEVSHDGFKHDRTDGRHSRLSFKPRRKPKMFITQEMVAKLCPDDILFKKRKAVKLEEDELSKVKSVDSSLFKIATEFCEWVEEVGLGKIKPEKVKEMFMVDDDDAVEDTIVVAPVEKLSLPKNIAKIVPDASSRAAIHRQVFWDSFYEKKKKDLVKRGLLRASTRIDDSLHSWFRTTLLSEDLQNFNFFWRKLEEENLIDDFIVWLIKNPREYKPEFLSETGAFERVEKERKTSDEVSFKFYTKRKSSVIAAASLSHEEASIIAKLNEMFPHVVKPEDS